MKGTYFISGIDTDCGKTVVTGLLAKYLKKLGYRVITQKFIQTGCEMESDDILEHRRIMEIPLQEVDRSGLTCPYIFGHPCSPHLAAGLENIEIDIEAVALATGKLEQIYDIVLLEGAGGLYVPYSQNKHTIDYVQQNKLPLILVASSKLGSINHTLLSLEACRFRGIELNAVIYNRYPDTDSFITNDSKEVIKNYLHVYFPKAIFEEVPFMKEKSVVFDFQYFAR